MPRRLFALALLAGIGCASPAPQRSSIHAHRIVALMPSFVEDLISIGALRQIVGVSGGTEDLPAVARVERVATFSSVDAERIVTLHPDLVFAIPAQMRFLVPLQRAGIAVQTLPDDTYAEIFSDLRSLGTLSGHEREARNEVALLQRETARLRQSERRFSRAPSVFVVVAAQPIWTAGATSYIGTLVALAGGRDAVGNRVGDYGAYSPEALLRDQPDAIVSDSSTLLPALLDREPWRSLRAVREHHVFIIANASLLERPGPRYVRGLAWLIASLRKL